MTNGKANLDALGFSPLYKTKLFWCAVGFPIILALVFFTMILASEELSVNWSASGLKNALELFQIPLLTMALIFPAVALVASNHQSQHTAKQIDLTIRQNRYSNFLKHREEFFKALEDMGSDLGVHFTDKSSLYFKIFPDNSFDNFEPVSSRHNGYSFVGGIMEGLNSYITQPEMTRILNDEGQLYVMPNVQSFYVEMWNLSEALHFEVDTERLDISGEWTPRYVRFVEENPLSHAKLIEAVVLRLQSFSFFDTARLRSVDLQPNLLTAIRVAAMSGGFSK